ncbi:MAG: hypothetical protein AB8F94_01820 [Saprospiraceae bacterium]
MTSKIPKAEPLVFMPNLVEDNKIIHKGIFSPGYKKYFYTESKSDFTKFNILEIQKTDNKWTAPREAFINSEFDDHGMSFSPDGNFLYFSSTRPIEIEGIPDTWHIWSSEKINHKWSKPKFVDIPNMRNKLVSHPSISNSGKIYFHSSNLDYSEMMIYSSEIKNGKFQDARIVHFTEDLNFQKCTPFISPNENYLIFAEIHQDQLKLKISFKDQADKWTKPKELSKSINIGGQGNPFVTPDERFLFFTKMDNHNKEGYGSWNVNWVDIKQELSN